jgi:Flp pilus assembly protein TadG
MVGNAQSPRPRGSRVKRESGQALIEVALLTPLLLAMALGVIDIGRYAFIGILVGNAARAGAAYGAQSLPQSTDTTGIENAADNDFQNNGQTVGTLSVSSSTSCGCDNAGTIAAAACTTATNPTAGSCAAGHWVVMISVTASGSFSALFGWPGIPKSLTISRTATLRVAEQ